MKSDEKGFISIGGFSAQTVAIIAIIGSILIAGYMGYIRIPGITPKEGGTSIDMGYILEDGTHVELEPGKQVSAFMDLQAMRAYKSSSKNTEITGVWCDMKVKPTGEGISGPVSVDWSWDLSGVFVNQDSGTSSVPLGSWTKIASDDAPVNLTGTATTGSYDYTWNFSATANAGGKSTNGSANGTISFYWQNERLEISCSADTGYQ